MCIRDSAYAPSGDDEMRLARLAVIREAEAGADGAAERDEPGGPLYDPPPGSREGYCSLYLERGLTLLFPAAIASAKRGVICADWSASAMRYQLDRKFDALDGSLRSLELTEIAVDDASVYPPQFPREPNNARGRSRHGRGGRCAVASGEKKNEPF